MVMQCESRQCSRVELDVGCEGEGKGDGCVYDQWSDGDSRYSQLLAHPPSYFFSRH